MTISEQHTTVLIVGAGPSGLMMAAQLLRYGIQPIIIDSKQGPTNHSKALAVQARSLEIYRQMGIIEKVLAGGKPGKGFAFYQDGEEGAQLLYDITGVDTLYPYILMYPQNSNERALLEYLTLNCCPVYWNTTLTGLQQTANKATAVIETDGRPQTLTADWIIGADGAHSPVRKLLNIPFNGDTYKSLFYLIDGKPADRYDIDLIRVYLSNKGLAGFFPMPEEGYYRIIGNLPADFKGNDEELKLEDVLPSLNNITGREIIIEDCRWLITYKLHHRMADSFRQGRSFLIGDAAHIHSPVGGQGMNTGLQDAYNLAWKLASVINNKAAESLLDSYAAERMPVAKQLLKTTDRAFAFAMSSSLLARIFKKYILSRLARLMWRKDNIRKYFFEVVSQTGISYRESKLSLHLSPAKNIKAGDRLPSLKVYDEKKQEETDLHQWCFKPGFTLIIMGKVIEEELFKIAKWLTQNHSGYIHFYYLPPSAKNQGVFDAFEVGKNQHLSILVRPDMYIGYLNNAIDLDRMDRYIQGIF